MKYLVYHSRNMDDMIKMLDKAPKEINLKNYDLVAMVASETLGDVFRITNHINEPWWNNPEVIKHYDEVRSTSVGDVIIEREHRKRSFMVMGVGLKEVKLAS